MEKIAVPEKLQTKLARAISKIGLSWATFSSIVDIRSEIEGIKVGTALWYYNPQTKKEHIAIDPSMIEQYNAEEIGLIVKHELLHKAMYRNIEGKDRAMVNFALDCCINKILTLSAPRNMYGFCQEFYNVERTGVTAIGNCSLTPDERDMLAKNIKEIWNSIYADLKGNVVTSRLQNNCCINQEVPDPLTIYNRLLLSLNKNQQEQIKKTYVYVKGTGDGKPQNEETEQSEQEDDNEDTEEQKNNEPSQEETLSDDTEDDSDESTPSDGQGEAKEPDTGEGEEDTADKKVDESDSKEGPEESPEEDKDANKIQIRGGSDGKRANDKKSVKDEVESVKETMQGGYCPHGVRDVLNKMIYEPQEANTKDLKAFIGTWQTMRQVEGIEATIYAEIASHIKFDPFPDSLSRTGFEYIALGVSGPDAIPLYLNQNDKRDARKKVCCYFDTSPSMNDMLPYMVHIAKFFEALEETQLAGGESQGKYVFAGSVEGLTPTQWNDMCNGEMKTGWSTDFDSVITHSLDLINEEDVDIIVILTDGESSLDDELVEKFNNTTKRCYRIYFDNGRCGYGVKRTPEGLTSSLDKLNGTSFTVKVGNV